MKKVVFMMSLLLTLGLFCACSNDDETSFISGSILLFDEEEIDDYVFIGKLTMPEGSGYNYIKTVVIPKNEFPLQHYHEGEAIDFNIVEVKSQFPLIQTHLFTPTAYLCSIKLCK